ncbi:hypothetical protein D9M69_677490 [compost metagenome]
MCQLKRTLHRPSACSRISRLVMLCAVRVSGIEALERSVLMRNTRSSKPLRLPYQINEMSVCGFSTNSSLSSQAGIQNVASLAYISSQLSQSLSSR